MENWESLSDLKYHMPYIMVEPALSICFIEL